MNSTTNIGRPSVLVGFAEAASAPEVAWSLVDAGFNVLAWIDIAHPEAELHVRSVVSWIYDETANAAWLGKPEDPFFAPMGRSLVTCLLAHLVWSDPASVEISLATFAAAFPATSRCPMAARTMSGHRRPAMRIRTG